MIEILIPEWVVWIIVAYLCIEVAMNITQIWMRMKLQSITKVVEKIRDDLNKDKS